MAKYISNRLQNLKIGIVSYTENKTVLEVTGNVGIKTANTQDYELYVNGDANVSGIVSASAFYGNIFAGVASITSLTSNNLNVLGVSTLTTLSVGGTTGTNGQYLKSTGTGLVWSNFTSLRSVYSYISTEGQKQFVASGINTGYVDVFLNGIRLDDINYSIIGTGVSLGVGAFNQDEITIVGFNTVNAGSGGSGSSSQTLDQTLALGNSSALGMSVGVITATNFVGNGSGLTGIIAAGTGIIIKDDGILVGTASTIDFGANLSVSPISAGVVTVTASGGSSGIATYATNAGVSTYATSSGITTYATNAGIATYATNAGIATYATSSGIATYATSSGIATYASIAGVSTNVIGGIGSITQLRVSGITTVGIVSAISINATGIITANSFRPSSGYYQSPNGTNAFYVFDTSGDVSFQGKIVTNYIRSNTNSNPTITVSDLDLQFARNVTISGVTTTSTLNVGTGGTVITTTSSGLVGIGTTNPQGTLQVGTGITMYGSTGIISATTFYGNLVGSITNATNLTGGYANASQLNVSGIATISQGRIQADASSNLRFGNIAAGAGSGRNIAIGDQVLYSLSGGQGRNIGIGELSYYDTTSGQYNIGLGIQAGQKITTGSYNVIIGGYDGQTGLDIRTSSNNVVIADGQGNIRQYIDSNGNVGIKTTVITEALTVAGIVSATSFYGTLNAGQLTGSLPAINGSALIGVVGSGSGIIIQGNGTPVGTAGTINFGSNINVTFASGIATVSSFVAGINTSGTSQFNQLSVSGVSTFTNTINLNSGNLTIADAGIIKVGSSDIFEIYRSVGEGQIIKSTADLLLKQSRLLVNNAANTENMLIANQNGSVELYYDNSKKFETLGAGVTVTGTTFTNQLSVSGGVNVSGIITASSFSGSGSGLTNLPAGQLTGTLPAIDGSALLNVTAAGTGIAIRNNNTPVGSATTVNFGTGLGVTFSAGIATITASGGSLQSRTTVSGVTTSISNNGIGNTNITGFKSYGLMKVGLSTAGWLRIYTDSTSRANDVFRSVGEDPAPGSGVIAEVVTTGITTTQIISPFVMGGNLDEPASTTIYAAITNLSGSTQAITANLTILQLEA